MNTPDPVGILLDLVRIPSHESEAGVADYLMARLEPLGRETDLRVRRRPLPEPDGGRCNVTAEWGKGPRSLILNSHMDTVPPGADWPADPLSPREAGGAIHGLGAADAKGSLAAMLAAFEGIARSMSPEAGRLVFSAVAMEETAGRGTEVEVQGGLRADAVVVGEPTALEVCVAHKGVLRVDVATRGVAAHASEPWEGRNAISTMGAVIRTLDELAQRVVRRAEQPVGRASLAITTIRGGTARNVIPATCTISIDRRLLPSEDAEASRAEIEAAVRRAAGESCGITQVLLAEAAATPADSRIARIALDAVSRSEGRSPAARGFGACCDMHLFRNLGGMPCVILGPGSLSQAHHADERVDAEEVRRAARIYADMAERAFRDPA